MLAVLFTQFAYVPLMKNILEVNSKSFPERDIGLKKIDLLRFFAIALVVNSHLENFYPIQQLAADGFLGNALFFSLSGAGLVLRERNLELAFHKWYWRRITRIYPSVLLVSLIFYLEFRRLGEYSVLDFVKLFLWPTPFNFIEKIMIFYIAYYFVAKLSGKYLRILFLILSLLFLGSYFLTKGGQPSETLGEYLNPRSSSSWIFYFQAMVLGGLVSKMKSEDNLSIKYSQEKFRSFASSLIFMGIYVILKGLMSLGIIEAPYVTLNIIVIFILFSLFLIPNDHFLVESVGKSKRLSVAIKLISSLTLEIYVVHMALLRFPLLQRITFPVSILTFVFISLLLAVVVNQFSQVAQSRLRSMTY
jgi:hypothetical protein